MMGVLMIVMCFSDIGYPTLSSREAGVTSMNLSAVCGMDVLPVFSSCLGLNADCF